MSIFKKRKPMSSTTTAAAPVMQDNPVASESSEGGVIINVVGIGTPEHWVHSNMGPQIPMPRQETIKLEEMPLKNCAVPAGWYFKEFSDPNDEEFVYRFPKEGSKLLALAFTKGVVFGTQFISFKYNRNNGTVLATAWGYNPSNPNSIWQMSVVMDVVQTFRDYVVVLPDGTPAMDARLCDVMFVDNLISHNILRSRIAYNMPMEGAEDVYGVLTEHISLFIRTAAQGLFKHDLQVKADRHYGEYAKTYEEKLKAIISKSDEIIAYVAAKEFYGYESNENDWNEAQELYNMFVQTTVALDATGSVFYQLRHAENICGVTLDLSKLVETINLAGTTYEKLRGLFDLLRG